MEPEDFEVAAISEWAEHCAHQDFLEAGAVGVGARFDFRAEHEQLIAWPSEKAAYGCADNGHSAVGVEGLKPGQAAFVEVVAKTPALCIARPLVFLSENITAPKLVAKELFEAERLVFLASHGAAVSAVTTQRAISFDEGKLVGWVSISGAECTRHGGTFVVKGEDSRGWSTALDFGSIASPSSIERMINGLRAKSTAMAAEAQENPEAAVDDFFGVPAQQEVYECIEKWPGIGISGISYETGLNRYYCRAMARRLYLEGKVTLRDKGYFVNESQVQQTGLDEYYTEQVPPGLSSGASMAAIAATKSYDDLAEFAYDLSKKQDELSKQIDQLHAEVKVLSSSEPAGPSEIADLRLHSARLDAEISTVLGRLETLEKETDMNIQALRERAEWAASSQAKLAWAGSVVRGKAKKALDEFNRKTGKVAGKGSATASKKSKK